MLREIKGFPNYAISADSVVFNITTEKPLQPIKLKTRQPVVCLTDGTGRRVSRSIQNIFKETYPELFKVTPKNLIIYHREGTLPVPEAVLTEAQKNIQSIFTYDPLVDSHLNFRETGVRASSTWEGVGYSYLTYAGKQWAEHQLIMLYMLGNTFEDAIYEIDHIDHVRDNNSWSNLRVVSRAVNAKNLSKHRSNTSGHTGVCWHKTKNKWRAYITVDYKQIHLGVFDAIEDAIQARREALIEYGFHENHGK